MRRHRRKGDGKLARIRMSLAMEAARLMVEEGVGQYLDAKRMAARRILGNSGARRMQFRPRDLPSNGEIRACVLTLSELSEGKERRDLRLFAMRVQAWELMHDLSEFEPRLIGSVSTGHVRRGSDIDLHVFPEQVEDLEEALEDLELAYESEEVLIQVGNEQRDYLHLHLGGHIDGSFPVELSVYEPRELRIVGRSSTDGRPIDRVKVGRVEQLLRHEHPALWETWLETGHIEGLEALLSAPAPGRFDGLVSG